MKLKRDRRGMALSAGIVAFAVAALSAADAAQPVQATPPAGATQACAGLASRLPADVRIESAVMATAGEGAGAVSVCRVQGVIEQEIGFELMLPAPGAWNGRFLVAGVGGQAGQLNRADVVRAAARGYAAASNDAGHKSADRHWLLKRADRAENYAGRANHVMTVKAKALAAAFYGQAPDKSFFVGCSGGGRQALTELQRYPSDFDGVIAGAPGVNTPAMSARRMWEMVQHSANIGVMSEADWGLLAKAAVTQCDGDDGLKDGIVTNPMQCRFRPKDLTCKPGQTGQCFNAKQVAVAETLYAPLKDETGRVIDQGLLPGVQVQPALVPTPTTPGPAYLAVVLFGDGVHQDANWDARTFNISRDLAAVDKVMNLHADDPKVEPFVRRGGKLILFQGLADPLVDSQSTVAYYDALSARFGAKGAGGFVRMFLAPGMGHCRGGGVPDTFGQGGVDGPMTDADHDLLTALERWVDKGVAPETVIASRLQGGKVVQSRPLCAYPKEARYKGAGDPNEAANFTCVAGKPRAR